jgi:hypothetical protein
LRTLRAGIETTSYSLVCEGIGHMNSVDRFAGPLCRRLPQKPSAIRSAVLIVIVVCISVNRLAIASDATSFRDRLLPFFHAHCIDCHNGTEADGGLDLAGLSTDLNDAEVMRRWVLIHDRVSDGEMPHRSLQQSQHSPLH